MSQGITQADDTREDIARERRLAAVERQIATLSMIDTAIPIVAAFPDDPSDDQEVAFYDLNTSFFWKFRYIEDIADIYKWVCTGGTPKFSSGVGIANQAVNADVRTKAAQEVGDLANRARLSVPWVGAYRVSVSASMWANVVGELYLLARDPVNGYEVTSTLMSNSPGGVWRAYSRERTEFLPNVGQIETALVHSASGGVAFVDSPSISIMPVRVAP